MNIASRSVYGAHAPWRSLCGRCLHHGDDRTARNKHHTTPSIDGRRNRFGRSLEPTFGPHCAACRRKRSRSHARCGMAQAPDARPVCRAAAGATERPFTSPLLNEQRRGNFACAGCDLDLFSSTTKFDSGTGWPSFWAPLEKAVGTRTTRRTAWCARPCIAAAAAAISAMSSMTGRSRPACATA